MMPATDESIRASMDELIASGNVAYGYIGVHTDDLWPALARKLGLKVSRGALISDVVPGGPADKAGLHGSS